MIQISITTGRDRLEQLEQALLAHGALSITLRDAADNPVLEPLPGETPLWPQVTTTGLFEPEPDIDSLRRALQALAPDTSTIEVANLEERDWTRAWLDDFRPLRFGQRLRIVPGGDWEPDAGAVEVRLDPGLAFGTGTHATTGLCLEWLDAHPPIGAEVIDYGCGSGILSLAAIKLGARRVRAVDIDPQALLATRGNAARNRIPEARILVCSPLDLSAEPANLALANILAQPLIMLAEHFAARVKFGGRVVLSGMLTSQTGEVAAAYAPWFNVAPARSHDGWALLEGAKLESRR